MNRWASTQIEVGGAPQRDSASTQSIFRALTVAPAILLTAAAIACNGTTILEDRDTSRGYAVITGTVRHTNGALAANHQVLFGGCRPDIATATPASTDGAGRYSVRAWLPPALPVRTDTVHVMCSAIVDYAAVPTDSIRLSFSADSLNPAQHTLDLTIP
jgi:hypothetical protein